MLGAKLALVILLGQLPAADPAALVERLGSPHYAEREEAAGTLEQLGRQALAALRAARNDRDPEVRARTAVLLHRIEGALLTQPTMVSLDFEDRPLPEVIQALSAQTGIKLGLIPENSAVWSNRRISVHETVPLPFWKAMDRFCQVAQLQFNFGMHGFPTGQRESVFPLRDGVPAPAAPTSDRGPFRVTLLSLHYQRDVAFSDAGVLTPRRFAAAPAPPPPPLPGAPAAPRTEAPTVTEQFYAQIQVAGEPRLSVSQNGPLKILEVTDDRGQSLQTEPDQGQVTQRVSGYFGLATGSTLQVHVPLKRPEAPGVAIRTLRGRLPITVASRKPDPLVIPLAGAAGKSFHNDDVDLTVLDIRANPAANQTSIDLMVRPGPGGGPGLSAPGAAGHEFMMQRPDLQQQQVEVVDTQGRVIAWFHSSLDAEGSRMTLTLTPPDQGAPAEIHYYGLARAATEVEFEFGDVPMP